MTTSHYTRKENLEAPNREGMDDFYHYARDFNAPLKIGNLRLKPLALGVVVLFGISLIGMYGYLTSVLEKDNRGSIHKRPFHDMKFVDNIREQYFKSASSADDGGPIESQREPVRVRSLVKPGSLVKPVRSHDELQDAHDGGQVPESLKNWQIAQKLREVEQPGKVYGNISESNHSDAGKDSDSPKESENVTHSGNVADSENMKEADNKTNYSTTERYSKEFRGGTIIPGKIPKEDYNRNSLRAELGMPLQPANQIIPEDVVNNTIPEELKNRIIPMDLVNEAVPDADIANATDVGDNSALEKRGRMVSMRELLAVSIDVAKRGGFEVKKVREQADIHKKSKNANEPVTDGDLLSHRAMHLAMTKEFPGITLVSEERETSPDTKLRELAPEVSSRGGSPEMHDIVADEEDVKMDMSDVVVWIDPLDATQEYTENLREFVTTMVCVAVKGKPVMGVIHKPFEDLTIWGWQRDANTSFVSELIKTYSKKKNVTDKQPDEVEQGKQGGDNKAATDIQDGQQPDQAKESDQEERKYLVKEDTNRRRRHRWPRAAAPLDGKGDLNGDEGGRKADTDTQVDHPDTDIAQDMNKGSSHDGEQKDDSKAEEGNSKNGQEGPRDGIKEELTHQLEGEGVNKNNSSDQADPKKDGGADQKDAPADKKDESADKKDESADKKDDVGADAGVLDLKRARIIVSRSHAGSVEVVARGAFGDGVTVTPAGGAGFKTWEVMKGNQDAYVHVTKIKKWDICAGDAILRALGGRLTTLAGAEVEYSAGGTPVVLDGGVLATMRDHDAFAEALMRAQEKP